MTIQRVPDEVDLEDFFRRGESFYFSAQFMWKQGLWIVGPGGFALIVNQAFALEVYLKVLAKLQHGQNWLDTHNLRELFHDLPTATQREARRLWLRKNKEELGQKLPQALVDMKIKNPKTFEEALDLSAKAFVNFRYNFEGINHWHVGGLLSITREMILKDQPDWKPLKGSPISILNPHPDFVKTQHYVNTRIIPGFTTLNNKPSALDIKVRRSSDPNKGGPR